MYKNQLQELAQRSCFSLPSYSRIREGPDHAPRFKATVNFNGETFESPAFCSTLRQAEHAAAEVALNTLAMRGPSRALAARVLDETGVYKNLLQETAHRAGLNLPTYTTVRSGPRHVPIYSSTVELAGMSFIGQPARTKKQAQKNAAMAAWSALRKMTQECASSSRSTSPSSESKSCEEQEQVIVARFLSNLQPSEKTKQNPHIDQLRSKGHGPHARSLYPVQCQSLAYSGFPPEMFIYHMWEQEKMLQQQHQMMALPFVPAITSHPRIFPLMHSVFGPESCQYFPVRQLHSDLRAPRIAIGTSGPSLCLSDQLRSDPTVSRSTVTIQEILDENTEQSRNSSPASTSGQPNLSSGDSELKIPKLVQGNVSQMKYGTEPKSVDVDWAKQRSWDSRSATPLSSSQVSHTFQSSHMYPRPQHLPRVSHVRCIGLSPPSAEPLMIRTMGHDPMTGHIPRTQNSQMYSPLRVRSGINMEGARPSFLAPPVRIRSVVPVCSAPPPPRRVPIPRQDSTSQRTEKKGTESDDTSA